MPVLARTLESAGLVTVMITGMPYWAERIGVPRTLAVEYPFGSTLGQPGDRAGQMHLIRQALCVLEVAQQPGTIVHSPEVWPIPVSDTIKNWQPAQPAPIIQHLTPRFRQMLRKRHQLGRE